MNRDFKGVWIPKEIWLCKDLTALDRCIYAEIDSLDNENHCTASNEYFAEFCGVGTATVTRSIQKLIDKGYIEVVSFDGRTRVIKLIKQTNQNDESPSSKRLANNIDNNTNNISILSKDNIDREPEPEVSEYESKQYSKEDFLGSVKHKKQPRKSNLYSKCMVEIDKFTNYVNNPVHEALVEYLNIRLNMSDKPIYGVGQWIGILKRLSEIVKQDNHQDAYNIISQSIERGWASFFPVQDKPSKKKDVFSEYGQVTCDKSDGKESSGVEF